jgi:branched-chain amino acid transport system permease protein
VSGYVSGIVAILCINLIFAYAIFATATAGQLNLGGAGFQAIGAYAAAYLSANLLQPVWVTVPVAMALGALVGFLISFPVLRTRGVYMVLATYAFGEVVAGYFLKSTLFGGAVGIVVPDHLGVGPLIVSAVLVTLAMFYLMATRLGLTMRSIHDDEPVATLMGVNVRATQVACFSLGGGLAGLAGALYAHHFSYVEAQYFNSLLSIYVLLFVLIGGTQTAWGPLAGSLFFTLLPEALRVGGSWRYVVFGAAIVVMMAVRPEGIVTRALVSRIAAVLRRPFRPALRKAARHAG